MDKKIKVLHIIHGLNLGGAENFIFNLLWAIDNEKFVFDFAIQEPEIKHKEFKQLIEEKGGTIHIIPEFTRHPLAELKALKQLFQNEAYDVIHIHNNALINPIPFIAAAKCRSKVIIHSHSTKNGKGGLIGKWIHSINRRLFLRKRFLLLSCSQEASKWMFGSKEAQVISNAIVLSKYRYDKDKRNAIRKEFGLTDEYVIGQVGRLIPLKNQSLSINLLALLKQQHPELRPKLMLLGEGETKSELEKLSKALGVEQDVIFVGAVPNAADFYSAFDVFLMPSWFEGLALVSVEAQAAGLKCFVSDTVTREVNISGTVEFLPLDSPHEWMKALADTSKEYDRMKIARTIEGSSFDSLNLATSMEHLYKTSGSK